MSGTMKEEGKDTIFVLWWVELYDKRVSRVIWNKPLFFLKACSTWKIP